MSFRRRWHRSTVWLLVGVIVTLSAPLGAQTLLTETTFGDWTTTAGALFPDDPASGAPTSGSELYLVRHQHRSDQARPAGVTSVSLPAGAHDPSALALDGPLILSVDIGFDVDEGFNSLVLPELFIVAILEQEGRLYNSAAQIQTQVSALTTRTLEIETGAWLPGSQPPPDLSPGGPPVRIGLGFSTTLVPLRGEDVEARMVIDNLILEVGGALRVSFAETYPPPPDSQTGRHFVLAIEDVTINPFAEFPLSVSVALNRTTTESPTVKLTSSVAGAPSLWLGAELNSTDSISFEPLQPILTFNGEAPRSELGNSPTFVLSEPSAGLSLGVPSEIEVRVLSCSFLLFGEPVPCSRFSGAFECAHELFDLIHCLGRPELCTGPGDAGPLRRANAESPLSEDPATTLRSFRDLRMAETPAGRYYRDLYEAHSHDLVLTFAPKPSLVDQIAEARDPWIEILDAAIQGRGDSAVVTEPMVDSMLAIIDRFETEGSPRLQHLFRSQRQRLGLEDITDLSIEQTIDLIEERGGPPECADTDRSLCLGQRFLVEVFWEDFQDGFGEGRARPLSSDTGSFWFFDQDNVELVVKVLDGTSINDRFWVFYGALSNVRYTMTITDTLTGAVRVYANPAGTFASVGDTNAFAPDGSRPNSTATAAPSSVRRLVSAVSGASSELLRRAWRRVRATFDGHRDARLQRSLYSLGTRPHQRSGNLGAGTCTPSPTVLCLNDSRFRIEVSWRDFEARTGVGQARALTSDTGTFWFFDDANTELIIKVLDAREVNGHFWVFYGALSNVEFDITVTDTTTGDRRTYRNEEGDFASAGDTEAFSSLE